MCFSSLVDLEEKVFVLEIHHDGTEYTFYIDMDSALSLAATSPYTVYIMNGRNRYHYYNGEPLFSIIESKEGLGYSLGENYESDYN